MYNAKMFIILFTWHVYFEHRRFYLRKHRRLGEQGDRSNRINKENA